MSQNPNDPYNLQSQWNPFPPNYNPQTPQSSPYNPYPTQASNSQMPGFGQTYNIPQTQVPSTQYPQSSSQFPQMTPETYHEFMLWKQNQAPSLEHSVEAETPTLSTKSSTHSFDESITTNFQQLTQSKASVYRTRDIAEAMRVLKMTTDGLSEDDAWFLNMEKEKIRKKFGWKRPGSVGGSESGGGSASEDVGGSESDDE